MLTYDRQLATVEPCLYMMERGIRVDIEEFRKARDAYSEEAEELRQEFKSRTGIKNPNSSQELGKYFFDTKGYKATKKTAKGQAQVDTKALQRLVTQGCEEAAILIDYKKRSKLITTYLQEFKISDDQRMRCSYSVAGTSFSRLSSRTSIFGDGMNMQNWPNSLLHTLLADLGYLYFSVDLSQAENRIVAYAGDVLRMIQAFEHGEDMHKVTAATIYDCSPEEVSAKEGTSLTGRSNRSQRDDGKTANHALNYGMGPQTFAEYNNFSLEIATKIHKGFHKTFPEIRSKYYPYVEDQAKRFKFIQNLKGRRTTFFRPSLVDNEGHTVLYSCIPQGTVGDIINEHGLQYLYYEQDKSELLMQVHDQVGFQRPVTSLSHEHFKEHAQALISLKRSLEITLSSPWGKEFVIPADFTMGLNCQKNKANDLDSKLFSDADNLATEIKNKYLTLLDSDNEQKEYQQLVGVLPKTEQQH